MERHRQHPACDFTGPTHPGPLEQNHDWIPGTGGVGVDPGKPATPSSCAVPTQPSPMPTPSMRHPPFSSSWTACGSQAASSDCHWSLGKGYCWRYLGTPMPPLLAPFSVTAKRRGDPHTSASQSGGITGVSHRARPAAYFLRSHLSQIQCPVQDLTGNVCKKKEKRRGYHCSKVAVTLLTRAAHPDSQRAYLGLETYSLPFCRCPCEVRARTHSLWSWLSQPKEQQRLRNPLYILNPLAICGAPEPAAGQGEPHTFSTGDYPSAQRPDLCSSSSGLFLRWTHSPKPAEAAWGKSVANSDRKGEDRSLSANYFSPHPKHWLLGQQPRHS
ncbi:uncharacterized protein isoform X2 [Macaca fascicularis]|uniref:uncharacterized protein isoform X2 n=1 Tax=Macaca fascicularis TaxID=9541 RepID=UPI0032B02B94